MSSNHPEVQSYYDTHATQYDDYAFNTFSWKYIDQQAMIRLLSPYLREDARVLDLGSGTGRILYYLQQVHQIANVYGVDISHNALQLSQQRLPDSGLIQANIIESVPFVSDYFNLAVSTWVFQYLDNEDFSKVLSHLYRVLARDSVLFYLTTHPHRFEVDGKDTPVEGWKELPTPWGGMMPFFRRQIDTFVQLTEAAGFGDIEVDECPIDAQGKIDDRQNYKKYRLCGKTRLAVRAQKK